MFEDDNGGLTMSQIDGIFVLSGGLGDKVVIKSPLDDDEEEEEEEAAEGAAAAAGEGADAEGTDAAAEDAAASARPPTVLGSGLRKALLP